MANQPSKDALEAFLIAERAYQDEDLKTKESVQYVTGLFSVAVKKTGDGHLPKVHRRYGELLFALGQFDLALQHVNIALQQDPSGVDGFFAQVTKIGILGNKGVKTFGNLGPGNFIHNRGLNSADNVAETIWGSVIKSLVAGGVSASVVKSQNDFLGEVRKLGQVFQTVQKINTDPNLFVTMAETVIETADYVNDFPRIKEVNLCKYIAETPLDKLNFQTSDQRAKVQRIRSIAVGRSETY